MEATTPPSPAAIRVIYWTLCDLLGPRPPAEADLCSAHRLISDEPAPAVLAFLHWAMQVSPDAPKASERLRQHLAAPQDSTAPSHLASLVRICRGLDRCAEQIGAHTAAEIPIRVTYLLTAALASRHPAQCFEFIGQAAGIDSIATMSHPLFAAALASATGPGTKEVA